MCFNNNDIVYCFYCQQWHKEGYMHTCVSPYYCNGCGDFVYGNHICSANVTYGYSTPFDNPSRYYKCPKCKGEFSEPFKKFTGKYKNADIKEFGSEVIVGNTKVPVYKFVCPFCGKEMKGLNR